ncbi:MAG TPA: SRPBCC domain-containing protein [Actinomycetota bacterium]
MEIPDEVRRELEIHAPRERVWAALTEPDQLLRWFPTKRAEIDLRPGGGAILEWDEAVAEAVVDEVDPPGRLVFRWRPEGLGRPFTTVSFTLEESTHGTSTHVSLVESGFASLPDQIETQSQKGNDEGWAHELQELKEYVEAA